MSVALRVAAPPQQFRKISSPRFVIGQDEQGHWVALDADGREGGLFANREAALKYVAAETGRAARPPCWRQNLWPCGNRPRPAFLERKTDNQMDALAGDVGLVVKGKRRWADVGGVAGDLR